MRFLTFYRISGNCPQIFTTVDEKGYPESFYRFIFSVIAPRITIKGVIYQGIIKQICESIAREMYI